MRLTRVAAENFRPFERLAFEPRPGVNLILGPNAAGKTSLLEAIHTLGRGRSFRGAPPDAAGPRGAQWLVTGQCTGADATTHALGVAWSPEGLRLRLDQADATIVDLVRAFPVEVLEPDSHRLLQDGPSYRRRYLDWGVFHVEHRFFPAWRRYRLALRQRNEALRAGLNAELVQIWDPEVATAGEEVHGYRAAHLEQLREGLGTQVRSLLGDVAWSLELAPGWPQGVGLREALAEHLGTDRQHGTTGRGPHRAELRLRLAGQSAKHQVSRGQQKLLVAALLLAQAQRIGQVAGTSPALLVDDFPAELGPAFQASLLAALQAHSGQVFITAIEPTPALGALEKNAMFHVEQGTIRSALRV